MSSVTISGDTSGSVILQAPSVAGSTTLTLPTTSGTVLTNATTQANLPPNIAGNGPAFSAYLGSNQSITSSVFTKIQCNTEQFDTNSNYDNATNYRFTPTVAGYYQINGKFASTVSTTLLVITIYKNGSEFIRGADNRVSQGASSTVQVNALVYCNGTTDYLELYGYIAGTSPAFQGASTDTYFQGFLARGA